LWPFSVSSREFLRGQALAALASTVFVTAAPAADQFAGTWKIVAAKSVNDWGEKPYQSMTGTYAPTTNGAYEVKIEGVDGGGKPVSTTLQVAGDAEQPVTDTTSQAVRMPGATHVKSRRSISTLSWRPVTKDGKSVGTSAGTVSADGHTLAMKLKGHYIGRQETQR
jgi:hypothetical protein